LTIFGLGVPFSLCHVNLYVLLLLLLLLLLDLILSKYAEPPITSKSIQYTFYNVCCDFHLLTLNVQSLTSNVYSLVEISSLVYELPRASVPVSSLSSVLLAINYYRDSAITGLTGA